VKRALAAVPAWGWLAAIVLVSFAFRAWLARGMVAPFIMVDELVYAELAKSFAADGELLVRGVSAPGYSIVYPVLISPPYALFDSLTDAYAAVKTINALLMSLAAVPAFLLARRVVPPGLSLLAAVLALALPSLVYTGTVMTENAFYPAFLAASLLLVLVLERPTWRRQAGLLAALGIAYATRQQALALVPALLTAPLLLALFRRQRLRVSLRPFAPLYGVVLAVGALVLVAQVVRGRSLSDLLGAYSVVGERHYDVGEVARFLLYHWAEFDLYLGVLPLAATIVLVGLAHKLDSSLQVYLAAATSIAFWLVLVVAAFASEFASRIQERNVFVVAPLFLIGLLAWADRGAPRPRVVSVGAAAASALLVLAIPFERFIDEPAKSDTLMLLPWWSVQDTTGLEWIAEIVLVLALAAAVLFLALPRRLALALPLVVLGYYAVVFKPIWAGAHGLKEASEGALFQGIRAAPRDWIDSAVPDGVNVAVLWANRADRFTVNQNEFFNRSVGPILFTTVPTPGGLGETPVSIGKDDLIVRYANGKPVRPRYVLTDGTSIDPDGEIVARDESILATTLWRLRGPLRTLSMLEGIYEDRNWSGPTVTWTRHRCRQGTLAVSLSSDPTLFKRPQTISAQTTIRTGNRTAGSFSLIRIRPTDTATLRVRVSPTRGTCVVRFKVTPTAIPADVIAGSTDDRVLGAHFNAFTYPAK
jgi:dolichyl-phosphate-mannose-protein mannosyltransferase